MKIFIDESGPFIPLSGSKSRVSCVVALAVPEAQYAYLQKRWIELSNLLGPEGAEVKGASLKSKQVEQVVRLLLQHDVLAEVSLIDCGMLQLDEVRAFQQRQAETIRGGKPENAHVRVSEALDALGGLAESLSPQEFVQAFVTIPLVAQIAETASAYYSLRLPKELGAFHWMVDAKGSALTRSEQFWTELILPAMQYLTESEPFRMIPLGNYSSFERHVAAADTLPKPLHNLPPHQRPIDSKKLYQENLTFGDSASEAGLQLVDIVANAFARAFNGGLQREQWEVLGRLLVTRRPGPVIKMILQTRDEQRKYYTERGPHGTVAEVMNASAKPLLTAKADATLRRLVEMDPE